MTCPIFSLIQWNDHGTSNFVIINVSLGPWCIISINNVHFHFAQTRDKWARKESTREGENCSLNFSATFCTLLVLVKSLSCLSLQQISTKGTRKLILRFYLVSNKTSAFSFEPTLHTWFITTLAIMLLSCLLLIIFKVLNNGYSNMHHHLVCCTQKLFHIFI